MVSSEFLGFSFGFGFLFPVSVRVKNLSFFKAFAHEQLALSKTGKIGGAGLRARQTMGSQGRPPHRDIAAEETFRIGH